MQKNNLNELIQFDDNKFRPNVLINEHGYRMVLLTMRAGQSVPEHATAGRVTVYVIRGRVNFYEGQTPCDLRQGEVLNVAPSSKHRVEAVEDSALLVLATAVSQGIPDGGSVGISAASDSKRANDEELDLREVPRPQRHPLIFAKFDALALGESLRLLNDHDPIPLNRQFDSIRSGEASWEYIERGPALYRIRIRRVAPSGQAVAV
ncbi:MAG TPA: DUF2249 domain-containing protein [Terriglobales bacterium]|nr:DUF2249 domain-containing protein [Terriglobales bacterium]